MLVLCFMIHVLSLFKDDSWQKPKGVTFGDIRSSLADVAWEAASSRPSSSEIH